jgi:hypothetical protein
VERIKDGDSNSGLIFDHDGVARVAYARNKDGTPRISYRPTPLSPWQPLAKSLAGYEIANGVFAEDNNTLYAEVFRHGRGDAVVQARRRRRHPHEAAGPATTSTSAPS